MLHDIVKTLFIAALLIGACLFIGFVFIEWPFLVLVLCVTFALSVYWILS